MLERTLIAAAATCVLIFAGPLFADHLNEGRYWVSPDRREVIIIFPEKNQTYYFNNDANRLCFSYTLSGNWFPTSQRGMLADARGKSVIGVRAYDDNELRYAKGGNIEERAADFITKIYEKYVGHGLDSTELRPFPSNVSGSLKWTASWIEKRQGQEWENSASKVFARLSPSWVAQITAPDDAVARIIIQTLNSKATADCYWPFIRKHIPALRTQ